MDISNLKQGMSFEEAIKAYPDQFFSVLQDESCISTLSNKRLLALTIQVQAFIDEEDANETMAEGMDMDDCADNHRLRSDRFKQCLDLIKNRIALNIENKQPKCSCGKKAVKHLCKECRDDYEEYLTM